MNDSERKNSVKRFTERWDKHGYEKGETHSFWLSFLRDVLNVSEPEKFIRFEVPVKLKHTGFIDAFLPDTKVIIEQKSLSENLSQEKFQSDGTTLTPYEQAQRYGSSLPYSMRPRWIVVCNFAQFLIYDMETLAEPTKIFLSELPEKFHALDFLVDKSKNKLYVELEFSLKASEFVGRLYDANHIFAESRPTHLKDFVPAIGIGNKPIDNGNFLFTFDEMIDFISREPAAKKFFRKWFGSREFMLNTPRYCLCLRDISPNELKNMPLVYQQAKKRVLTSLPISPQTSRLENIY